MVCGAWPTNEIPITENADIAQIRFLASVAQGSGCTPTEWKSKHPNAEVVILRPTTALAGTRQISWVARSSKHQQSLMPEITTPAPFSASTI